MTFKTKYEEKFQEWILHFNHINNFGPSYMLQKHNRNKIFHRRSKLYDLKKERLFFFEKITFFDISIAV